MRHLKVLVCADREEFPKADELVKYIKTKFPLAEEMIINKPVISKEDVIAKLNEGFDIYFLIGHSVPNLIFPELSYFQLTPIIEHDQKPYRLDITLNDFKEIDWSHAEIVFLIGCETAVGRLYEGSGFSGFQQNLLIQGAKRVIATPWKIDNSLAFGQVRDFLTRWEGSNNPALVLQDVEKEWIRSMADDAFYQVPHPYLWKMFTLSQTVNHN